MSKIFKIIYVVVLQWDSKKKIADIAERKYKTIIIYDLHDEQNKEREMKRWSIQLSRQIIQTKRKDRWKIKREMRWASANKGNGETIG